MGYWMLVVSQSDVCASQHAFEVPLYSDFDADYEVRDGTEEDWREVELYFTPEDGPGDDGPDPDDEFATVFREADPAAVKEEVAELIGELEGVEPAPGAKWVASFLRGARTIYRFTPHDSDETAMEAVRAVMAAIRQETGGISYAEGEGWSNQDGALVTWELDGEEGHEGAWRAAVLGGDGRWQSFSLELSDAAQRRAFREGRVPEGARKGS